MQTPYLGLPPKRTRSSAGFATLLAGAAAIMLIGGVYAAILTLALGNFGLSDLGFLDLLPAGVLISLLRR
jgi:hypothetical protein